MSDEKRTITIEHPGDIDGEPHEVAEQAVANLAEVSMVFAGLVEATVKQVENMGRQAALNEADGASLTGVPGALDEWWRSEYPAQAARAEALRVVAERLPAGVRALHSALHQDR